MCNSSEGLLGLPLRAIGWIVLHIHTPTLQLRDVDGAGCFIQRIVGQPNPISIANPRVLHQRINVTDLIVAQAKEMQLGKPSQGAEVADLVVRERPYSPASPAKALRSLI